MPRRMRLIHWTVNPEIISAGPLHIRWYGIMFLAAFSLGRSIIARIFSYEGIALRRVDTLLAYMVAGTIIGARVGHCLVYETQSYLANPLEILEIWNGGLASHGAAVGIILALWVYNRRNPGLKILELMDRISIPVALAGFFIRLGNLFNSEIVGLPTTVPWAFIFVRLDSVPRHPTQLYEAFAYLFIFVILRRLYWSSTARAYHGRLLGLFLVLIFSVRFIVEFLKENQEPFEAKMLLNLGQILSLPLILAGGVLLIYSIVKGEDLSNQK